MQTVLKTRLSRIGNSQGIRIPKIIIEQLGFGEEVELEVQSDHLIVRPAHTPRAGWDEQFEAMAAAGDDSLLDAGAPSLTRWDEEEWEW
ncbi:MAG TPA: AbrB/MazE/SpoVT family DNA-binding domain-containing protein [Anaerolineae bacterium]|nr:AbrB/MazE/SpoVT family DNA-binding domain-containing protein [Anaerolineae bacterium]